MTETTRDLYRVDRPMLSAIITEGAETSNSSPVRSLFVRRDTRPAAVRLYRNVTWNVYRSVQGTMVCTGFDVDPGGSSSVGTGKSTAARLVRAWGIGGRAEAKRQKASLQQLKRALAESRVGERQLFSRE